MSTDHAATARGRRRADILATAGEAFGEHGYHGTTMRGLAAKLDLQGPSLYAHIASKEELLLEIVARAAASFLAVVHDLDPTARPRDRLRAFVRGHLRVMAEELAYATVFFHEWQHLSTGPRSAVVAQRDAYEAALNDLLLEGAASGDFEVGDARIATLMVLSTLNWSYQWLDPNGRLSLEELTAHYTDYILGALGAGKEE